MSLQDTVTYLVSITLSTKQGEAPGLIGAENLIITQMGGELDEDTGLTCIDVDVFDYQD
jgi:hypothetical protein